MENAAPPPLLKCVLVGDAAVGKTYLVDAYIGKAFSKEYVPTAFDNYTVVVSVDCRPLRLQLSDTAGQAKFGSLCPFSYPDTDVFLLCFSLVDPKSLHSVVQHWLPEISKSAPDAPIILVGTRQDLKSSSRMRVSDSEVRRVVEDIGAEYFECSAITRHNLKEDCIHYYLYERQIFWRDTSFQVSEFSKLVAAALDQSLLNYNNLIRRVVARQNCQELFDDVHRRREVFS